MNKKKYILITLIFLLNILFFLIFNFTVKLINQNILFPVLIFFSSVTSLAYYYIFMHISNLKKYSENQEINALYNQVDAYDETITDLNDSLNLVLEKYMYLVDSLKDLDVLKNYSEDQFILTVHTIAKKLIKVYDYSIVFKCTDNIQEILLTKGYNIETLKKINIPCSVINEQYPKTGLYNPQEASIKYKLDSKQKKLFNKLNIQSKELIFLCLTYKSKKIGGMFFELDKKNPHFYSNQDLSILRALQNIFENYYESNELKKIKENSLINIVKGIINILEFHDPYTKGHSINVANISKSIGERLNLKKENLKELYLSGLLHDIGKTFIDEKILNKKDKLSPKEYKLIKEHPEKGAKFIENIESLRSIKSSIKYHHERYDGLGYPDGLKGDNIPLNSQIIAVADAYDAMTSNRPYRKALTKNKIISEIENNIKTQFAEKPAKALVELIEKDAIPRKKYDIKIKP